MIEKPRLLVLQTGKYFDQPTYAESPPIERVFDVFKKREYSGKADLIYCQAYGAYAKLLPEQKVPYVIHMGGNPWLEMTGKKLVVVNKMLEGAALVTCVSKFLATEIRKHFSGDPEKVVALPGGLWGQNHTNLGPRLERFQKKRSYSLGNPPTLVMSIQLIDNDRLRNKWRGIGAFLEASEKILKKNGARVLCCGRGSQKFVQRHRWDKLCQFDFVGSHHLDDENDMWSRYLRESDIFVHPGTYDCWPRVVAEAMITGLPVVGYDVTGNAEVGREVGSWFEPDDVDTMARRIDLLLNYKSIREWEGKLCRQYAVEMTRKHNSDLADLLLKVSGGRHG